jgi:hypothetical protein
MVVEALFEADYTKGTVYITTGLSMLRGTSPSLYRNQNGTIADDFANSKGV